MMVPSGHPVAPVGDVWHELVVSWIHRARRVLLRGPRQSVCLLFTLSSAWLGAPCAEAADAAWTGWRSDRLPPDTLSQSEGAASETKSMDRRVPQFELAAPRDTIRLADISIRGLRESRPLAARPGQRSSELWGTDGNVLATARSATSLYVAGSFKWLGPNTGAFVPLSKHTGAPAHSYAKVAGEIRAIASDGQGGWYIGGVFNAVGGRFRHNLAHVLHDGRVSDWDPRANGADVNAIAVSGRTVYVGGGFTSIGGAARRYIAALDARTAEATSWDPWSSGGITSLAVRGHTIFVGGAFDSIAGARRQNLVAIDAANGLATPWRMDAALQVDALLLHGDTLFVGGRFPWIGGRARLHLAAVDVAADTLFSFDPSMIGIYSRYLPTPTVNALAIDGRTLYAGGLFTGVGAVARAGLAAIDLVSGLATSWDPGTTDSWIRAIAVDDDEVYVGGYFDHLGGQERWGIGAVDRVTGEATKWNPTANGPVEAIVSDGRSIVTGGFLSSVGPQVRRNGIAELDLRTGAPTAWNPNPVGRTVFTLALGAGRVFAGGDFVEIGGQPRTGIAAVDTVTGAAMDWSADANGPAEALALHAGVLYVGGEFTALGGVERSNLASVDPMSGLVSDWNPACNGAVYALALTDNTLYAAGYFSRLGGAGPSGVERDNLAAIDPASGLVSAWNPGTDSRVNAVVPDRGVVYVGGAFTHVGGLERHGVAAVDANSGVPTAWRPDADGEVKAVATLDGRIYLGGYFQHAGGQVRSYLGAVDEHTAAASEWDPHADAAVWSLSTCGGTIYAGGVFTSVDGMPHSSLASIAGTAARPVALPLDAEGGRTPMPVLISASPNPAGIEALVRFSLPRSGSTTLSLLDVEGRRVDCPLDQTPLAAGRHQVTFHLEGLRPGVYFYRLETPSGATTRKLLILR
jgi:trimeric autotransporter adhesin